MSTQSSIDINAIKIIFVLIAFAFHCQSDLKSQELVLVDLIEQVNPLNIKDIDIDQDGNRYYALDLVRTPWIINGKTYNLSEDSNRPTTDDQSYIFRQNKSGEATVFYPGGSELLLTDTSFVVVHASQVDTVMSPDTILISPHEEFPFGSNLTIWNRGTSGELYWAKMWPTSFEAWLATSDLQFSNDNMYLSGIYLSEQGDLDLDSVTISANTGDYEVFVNKLTKDLVFNQGMQIMNDFNCTNIQMDVQSDQIFGVASCESVYAQLCDLKELNQADILWRSAMPFWFIVNLDFECIEVKTAKYDRDVIGGGDAMTLGDKNITVGSFTSNYMEIDGNFVFATNPLSNGFLSIMDDQLNSKYLKTVDEANGFHSFRSLEKIDNSRFLVSGDCSGSNLSFDGFELNVIEPFYVNGFIAIMDTAANIQSIHQVDGRVVDFIRGKDNNIYARVNTGRNEVSLFLVDGFSSTKESDHKNTSQWNIHPLPVYSGESLVIELPNETLTLERINLFDINGKRSVVAAANQMAISTVGLSSGVYIVQVQFSDGQMDSKRIVIFD